MPPSLATVLRSLTSLLLLLDAYAELPAGDPNLQDRGGCGDVRPPPMSYQRPTLQDRGGRVRRHLVLADNGKVKTKGGWRGLESTPDHRREPDIHPGRTMTTTVVATMKARTTTEVSTTLEAMLRRLQSDISRSFSLVSLTF